MINIRILPVVSAVAFATLLAGCSTSSERVTHLDPNTMAYRISCDGPFSSRNACYERAADICLNKGYTVVSDSPLVGQDWMSDKYQATFKCNDSK